MTNQYEAILLGVSKRLHAAEYPLQELDNIIIEVREGYKERGKRKALTLEELSEGKFVGDIAPKRKWFGMAS